MSIGRTDAEVGDPDQMLGLALKTAQHAFRGRMDADLRGIGLTTPQYAALNHLEREAGASNAVLARRAFVTPQTMQAILVGLERSGHVRRTPHPRHGRIQTTDLTERGRAALGAAHAIVAGIETVARDAVGPLDPDAATAMLLRVAGALRGGPKRGGASTAPQPAGR